MSSKKSLACIYALLVLIPVMALYFDSYRAEKMLRVVPVLLSGTLYTCLLILSLAIGCFMLFSDKNRSSTNRIVHLLALCLTPVFTFIIVLFLTFDLDFMQQKYRFIKSTAIPNSGNSIYEFHVSGFMGSSTIYFYKKAAFSPFLYYVGTSYCSNYSLMKADKQTFIHFEQPNVVQLETTEHENSCPDIPID